MSLDVEYTSICRKLENELELKNKSLNEKLETLDKIEIGMDKVRFLIFKHLLLLNQLNFFKRN